MTNRASTHWFGQPLDCVQWKQIEGLGGVAAAGSADLPNHVIIRYDTRALVPASLGLR